MSEQSGQLKNTPTCPRCEKKLDGWTAIEDDQIPGPDDVTVCVYCSAVLQFDENMQLQFATAEAVEEVMLQLSQVQGIVKEFRKEL
jgi:hypothetical protein